ncbi:MAG: CBS domain-containing protein [Alphaproteobacteria bacterium]|nr:CBS domain-containing protein [Alphaproteobacteria bacterium]
MSESVSTLPVREVMTKEPMAVHRDMTIGELVILFDHHDYNGFPVVDEEGVLAGIVTKLDLLNLLRPDATFEVPDLASISDLPVNRIMRHGIITVEPDDVIAIVADLMVETRLRSIPVVQRHSGKPVLVGIVSRNDLLRRFLTEARAEPHQR